MPTPNLLFLFTDEQRADTLAAYGNARIHMPNLNRLAEGGFVFRKAYVTQPVCTPSRSSILTGLWPHTTGCTANNVPLRAETPCLPEMLPPGRYVSGYYGKWHLGDEIFPQHGFDEWRSVEDMYGRHYGPGRDRAARSDYHHFLAGGGFAPDEKNIFRRSMAARLAEEFSKPAFLAREARDFLRRHRRRPFVLMVNFLEPHMPFTGPRDGQYDPADVALPLNFDSLPAGDQPLKARLLHRHYHQHGLGGLPLASEADWRRVIANYWGLNSLVDTHAGAILDTLDDLGLAGSTIVVYTSDHGDMMGSHRLIAKCVMFEEAATVPLILRLPGQRRSARVPGPVSQIDLVPTLLDLMGCPVPAHLQGRSLRPLLEGAAAPRDDVFIEWNGDDSALSEAAWPSTLPEGVTREQAVAAVGDPVRTVVTPDGWKFNCSPLGEHELYNLAADPLETRNLAADPQSQPVVRRLRDRIRQWQRRTGDTIDLEAGSID